MTSLNSRLHKYQLERAERNKMEIELGALKTRKAMAEGLVVQLLRDYGMQGHLVVTGNDARQWEVHVDLSPVGDKVMHVENFFDFPTQELLAMHMLITGKSIPNGLMNHMEKS